MAKLEPTDVGYLSDREKNTIRRALCDRLERASDNRINVRYRDMDDWRVAVLVEIYEVEKPARSGKDIVIEDNHGDCYWVSWNDVDYDYLLNELKGKTDDKH